MNANAIVLAGRVTRDPEAKTSNAGKAYCQFTIAVDRSRGDEVDFFDCVTFGKSAERLGKWGKRGALVLIAGRIQQDRWEKDGQKRSKVVVVADSVRLGQVEDGFASAMQADEESGYGDRANRSQGSGGSGGYRTQEAPPPQKPANQGAYVGSDDAPF